MLNKALLVLLSGLIMLFSQCNQNGAGGKQKLRLSDSNQLKDTLAGKEVSAKKEAPGESGESDTQELGKKLDDLITQVNGIEGKISDLATRVDGLETGKKPKPQKKVTLKSLDKKVNRLRKNLRWNRYRQRRLIRRLCGNKVIRNVRSYRIRGRSGSYRIYVGAFKSRGNANARRRHISRLGIPVIISKRNRKYRSRYVVPNYKVEENAYAQSDEADGSYYIERNRVSSDYQPVEVKPVWGGLYKVMSKRKYRFRDAVRLTNYLLSKGYEAYIRK